EKDAEHVQLDGNDHQVRRPAVHVAQQFAIRHVVFEVKNVAERLNFAGVIVKHEHDAGESQHKKQIKGNAAHSPRVAVANRIAIDFCRMEVEKNIGEDAECAIARRVVVLVTENRSKELGLRGLLQQFDLLLRFRRQIALE